MLTSFYFEKANNGPTLPDYIKSRLSSHLRTIGSGILTRMHFNVAYQIRFALS